MSESSLKSTLFEKIKKLWVPTRIESMCSPGFPDVFYTNSVHKRMGLLELKFCPRWPARSQTPVDLRHFSIQQRLFFARNNPAGCRGFFLLQVGKDYLLFDGHEVGKAELPTKDQLFSIAIKTWKNKMNPAELIDIL